MFLVTLLVFGAATSCANDDVPATAEDEPVADGSAYFGGRKVLIAYFSWGGTTQRMAQQIHDITGGDLFRIEPVVLYPEEYTPCTVVAREEKDNNARPAIKDRVAGWDD